MNKQVTHHEASHSMKQLKQVKQPLMIALGSLLFAIAINYFLIPTRLGEGGVTGMTTILYYTLEIPPYLTNFVLNTIILIIGWKFLDGPTIIRSLWAVACMSLFLKIPIFYHYTTPQTIIPTLASAVLTGIALGLILNNGGSVAGSTVLAKIFNKYLGIPIGTGIMMMDLCVALPMIFIIGFENLLLTLLYLYISNMIANNYLARFGSKKAIQIISTNYNKIAQLLSDDLKQGVTLIQATGFYYKSDQPIVYAICSSRQLATVIPSIREIDDHALIIIDDIRSARAENLYRLL